MKTLTLVLSALLLFTHGPAQEQVKPPAKDAPKAAPADPFVKEKVKKADAGDSIGGPAAVTNLGVVIQYIDVKRERWQQWLAANDTSLDASGLRKEVETWVAAGDAILAESSLVMGRSGQRAKVESVRTMSYPTDFDEHGDGEPFPEKIRERNVGTTTEEDTVLGNDGTVHFNSSAERVFYSGENSPRVELGVAEGDVRFPIFHVQRASSAAPLNPDNWSLWACEASLENPTHQTLIFLRPVLHKFQEPGDDRKGVDTAIATFTWFETSHEAFNDSLLKTSDLSGWLGGGLHDELKQGSGKVVEQKIVRFWSGQRTKSETVLEWTYPTEFEPYDFEHFAVPSAFVTRKVGSSVEFDAVLSTNGDFLDINCTAEITSFAGQNVLHRILLNGEWKPNFTMPSFYTMHPTTQLSLPINIPVLVAVMSPPNEKGWSDPSRKVLLFAKFSR